MTGGELIGVDGAIGDILLDAGRADDDNLFEVNKALFIGPE
jgi:hypothetical protein